MTSEPTNVAEPVLLLNGFGLGSFHQHRLIPHLILPCNEEDAEHHDRVVYGLDYLGQGKSWPIDCDDGNSDSERGLRYCIYTWADQVSKFIEEVVLPNHPQGTKIHIVGNSLGGHLAVILALQRKDLVGSITLLNATPVWGLNLPFWTGHLPPPPIPRLIGRYLFDQIRNEKTIEKYLEAAYARKEAFDNELVSRYLGNTKRYHKMLVLFCIARCDN